MRPDCVKVGYGDPQHGIALSVVVLFCDFDDEQTRASATACLLSVRETAPVDCEIICVLNNVSTELLAFVEHAADRDGRIVLINLSVNLGVVAKNLGYEIAQGKLIFSIDGDVLVRDRKAFTDCVTFMESRRHIHTALIGPCGGILDKERWTDEDWPIAKWEEGSNAFGYDDPIDFGGEVADLHGMKVDAIPSLFWCFRKEVMEEVGSLDWRFGPFVGSDSDFCFRVKEAGYDICLVRVPITHYGGGASTHKAFKKDIDFLRGSHIKLLYDLWYEKFDVISEGGK